MSLTQLPWLGSATTLPASLRMWDRAIDDLRPHETTPKGPPWSEIGRPSQQPPDGDWRFWLLMAGRGFGKTRTGAEYICGEIFANRTREIMLIAATTTDVRDIVVEGPSGIMKTAERIGLQANYEPSKMRVTFGNGAIARTRGADEPDRIRGPECDLAWWDEFGTWKKSDAFTNADFGLRRRGPNGERARAVVSFTPKPTGLVRQLVKRTKDQGEMIADAVLRIGSTYENSDNLDAATLASYRRQYEGTRLGRQELAGELLEDVEGALWTLSLIDDQRIPVPLGKSAMQVMTERGIELSRVVVGVDPPASSTGAECGIVVAGKGSDKRGYVLDDRSRQGTPNEWATAAIAAFDEWNADAVVIEVNQGGDMAINTLRTIRPTLPIKAVHASRGKATRAEPISALYEQGRISHVGFFPSLEDQMVTWVQGEPSPDRMDAMVWAFTDLAIDPNYQWSDYDTGDLDDFLRAAGVG